MAHAADLAGIQWRTLNASKGPAVRATRCQADRSLYRSAIRRIVEAQPNLTIFQAAVDDLVIENNTRARRHHPDRPAFRRAVGGADRRHLPRRQDPCRRNPVRRRPRRRSAGDRAGAQAARRPVRGRSPEDRHAAAHRWPLAGLLGDGGTARRRSAAGDVVSRRCRASIRARSSCWITHTSERTHEIIRGALHRSPLYSGQIEGIGPRYCPSIEDKVVRFAEKASAPDLRRARRPGRRRDLSQRHLHLAAVRRAAGAGAQHPRHGERAHHPPGLRDRVRLLRSART